MSKNNAVAYVRLELPPSLLKRLRDAAARREASIEEVARDAIDVWLVDEKRRLELEQHDPWGRRVSVITQGRE